jgi:hypothetical protein
MREMSKILHSVYGMNSSSINVKKRILIDIWHFILINKDKNFRIIYLLLFILTNSK